MSYAKKLGIRWDEFKHLVKEILDQVAYAPKTAKYGQALGTSTSGTVGEG